MLCAFVPNACFMLTLPAQNTTLARAVGFVAMLVVACCAGETRAGCGEHVVVLSAKSTPATANPERQQAPESPCRGPNCSLKPTGPLPLVPPPLVAKPLPPDAILSESPTADTPDTRPMGITQFTPFSGHPLSVFHPPRSC